jgi:uncharacterized protein (DUF1697 family)
VRHLALLRGINVGGNTIIKMADLRACVETVGVSAVTTYIASGNVLFDSDGRGPAQLESAIEHAIEQHLQLPVMVIVLDRDAFGRIASAIPPHWVGDADLRANVAFVRRGTEAAEIVRGLDPDPAIDEVKAVPGAVLWATKRSLLNRSVMRKVIGGAAYRQLTVRSVTTTLRLNELLGAAGD